MELHSLNNKCEQSHRRIISMKFRKTGCVFSDDDDDDV